MRKLNQIIRIDENVRGIEHGQFDKIVEVLALDANGELWFGKLEVTDDDRRVVDWSPVNTPEDGVGYTKEQMSFFDKWEKEAHEIIEADRQRDALSLASEAEVDASGSGEAVQAAPDDGV